MHQNFLVWNLKVIYESHFYNKILCSEWSTAAMNFHFLADQQILWKMRRNYYRVWSTHSDLCRIGCYILVERSTLLVKTNILGWRLNFSHGRDLHSKVSNSKHVAYTNANKRWSWPIGISHCLFFLFQCISRVACVVSNFIDHPLTKRPIMDRFLFYQLFLSLL